jgi:hypothetical protein
MGRKEKTAHAVSKYFSKPTRSTTMGLGSLTPEGEEESDSQGQSTYITFKNPSHDEVELSDNSAHRHEQAYYDAVQQLRDELGQDINVPIGMFAAAAVEAEKGETERFDILANHVLHDYDDHQAPVARFVESFIAAQEGDEEPLKELFNEITS